MNREILSCLLIGASAGTVSGLTGLGGGVIMVPMLLGLLGLAQHKAHGTSLAIVGATAVAAASQYAMLGNLDFGLALQLAAGSVVGATIGARLMTRIPARQLRRVFGVFLLLVGLRLIVR